MDELQAALVKDWNQVAIASAIAGLATSLCGLGIALGFAAAILWLMPMVVVFFALMAIIFLVASFFSESRRGSVLFGSIGAVFGVGVPIGTMLWVIQQVDVVGFGQVVAPRLSPDFRGR